MLSMVLALCLLYNELSEAMSLTTSTSTRMIDSLVKEGFVERGQDRFDRRLVVVRLTQKGKKLTKDIRDFRDKYFESTMSWHLSAK